MTQRHDPADPEHERVPLDPARLSQRANELIDAARGRRELSFRDTTVYVCRVQALLESLTDEQLEDLHMYVVDPLVSASEDPLRAVAVVQVVEQGVWALGTRARAERLWRQLGDDIREGRLHDPVPDRDPAPAPPPPPVRVRVPVPDQEATP